MQNCRLHSEVQGSNSLHSEVQSRSSSSHSQVQGNRSHSKVQNCRLHSEVQSRGCSHPEVHCQNNRLHSEVTNKGNNMQNENVDLHPEMQKGSSMSHPQVQNTQKNGRLNTRKSKKYMENGKKNNTQVHNIMSASETHTNQENEQEFVNS